MVTQIPAFRLAGNRFWMKRSIIFSIWTEFIHISINMSRVLKEIVDKDYDAIFIGTGAPRGKDLPKLPGRWETKKNIHIGIDWLASVAFEHTTSDREKSDCRRRRKYGDGLLPHVAPDRRRRS